MADTDRKRLDEIEARVSAATEGPWQWWNLEGKDQGWTDNGPALETVERGPMYSDGSQGAKSTVVSAWGHDAWGTDVGKADAEFIAAARDDIPFLLARLRTVEAERDAANQIIGDLHLRRREVEENVLWIANDADTPPEIEDQLREAVCVPYLPDAAVPQSVSKWVEVPQGEAFIRMPTRQEAAEPALSVPVVEPKEEI